MHRLTTNNTDRECQTADHPEIIGGLFTGGFIM